MSWLILLALIVLLAPTVVRAYREWQSKNRVGAVGLALYLAIILSLAVYQIFLRS